MSGDIQTRQRRKEKRKSKKGTKEIQEFYANKSKESDKKLNNE